MTAKRVRLSRAKGYRKPPDAIVVARPSRWGNPFPVESGWMMWMAIALGFRADVAGRRQAAVHLYRAWLAGSPVPVNPAAAGGVLEFADGSVLSIDLHVRGMACLSLDTGWPVLPLPPSVEEIRMLAGRDLACWCPLDASCHADVLLELANR